MAMALAEEMEPDEVFISEAPPEDLVLMERDNAFVAVPITHGLGEMVEEEAHPMLIERQVEDAVKTYDKLFKRGFGATGPSLFTLPLAKTEGLEIADPPPIVLGACIALVVCALICLILAIYWDIQGKRKWGDDD